MTKQIVKVRYELDRYFLDGSLENALITISDLINEFGETAELSLDMEWIGMDGDIPDFHIIYEREETDKEYNKRLKQEKAQKERRKREKLDKEERERKQYEKLKKKYEKT